MKKRRKRTNNMQFSYLVFIAFMLFSCRTETTKQNEINNQKISNVRDEEDFTLFLEKFGEDSVFQLSRISFPISYYKIDIEDNKEEFVYQKNDFWYIDFSKDISAANKQTDAFESLTKMDGDAKATYIRKGIDNGIRMEYYFERNEKGEWWMVKVVDNSN
jgi:hypothetical protein